MEIKVTEEFINHRTDKTQLYNQRGRTNQQFLEAIDCEILEWFYLKDYKWTPHKSWMVDGINHVGNRIDVKFLHDKWWHLTLQKMNNVLLQRNILDAFSFWEFTDKPNRPLEAGDTVTVSHIRDVDYTTVADNILVSKQPGRNGIYYYFDARGISRCPGGTLPTRYDNHRGI